MKMNSRIPLILRGWWTIARRIAAGVSISPVCLARYALLAAFVAGAGTTHGQYTILDLGLLDGHPTLGRALNNSGQVAGFSNGTSQGSELAFRTAANSPINASADKLGTLGGTFSEALGLNDGGQAVGLAGLPGNFYYHAFRTAPGGTININSDLGTLGGFGPTGYSLAFAVNMHGQAVGVSQISGSILFWPARAFRTAPNQKINSATDNLGTLGGSYSEARDINASGQVVGSAYLAGDAAYHAFRTAANAAINAATDDLGTLGGTSSAATGINGSGQVVGRAQVAGDTAWRAFKTAPNAPLNPATDSLGTLGGRDSQAMDINSAGIVVGHSLVPDGSQHAFLHDGTSMRDLNVMIPAGSDWVLTEANSINDNCQITGTGLLAGVKHAYLLTPVSGNCTLDDLCPDDPGKTAPGQCGCGNPDTDGDGDGTADCIDGCPGDSGKSAPGQCGCGVADTDSDNDGVADCNDQCPGTPAGSIVDADGCTIGVAADFNGDTYVDRLDFEHLQACRTRAQVPQTDPACTDTDLDRDSDTDLDDFAIFQRCYSGPGVPAVLNCGG